MTALASTPIRRPRPFATRTRRGAATSTVLGGLILLVAGVGFGLTLSGPKVEPQGAYEPPIIPGRNPGRRSSTSRRPKPRARAESPPVVGAATSPIEGAPTTPPLQVPAASFAVGELGFRVAGDDARALADAASTLLHTNASAGSPLVRARVSASDRPDPPLDGARAVIAIEPSGLRLGLVSAPPADADVIAALIPPVGLVGEALEGFLLPVQVEHRPEALGALCALLANDAGASLTLASVAGNDAGARVLAGYAHLVRKELSDVHQSVLGLGTDSDVGPVARFLTGSALLVDGNIREALRDFNAAVTARPTYWPARLMAGTADDRLALPEAARDQFATVLAAVPGRPEAVIGYAPLLARTDRPAAIALVERLLAERPALVPGWWQLAWLRRQGDTSEDLQKGIEALGHVVDLRPADADAWGALALAHSRWASSGGGVEAFTAASAAFARQCELAPDDGLAWFGQAAMLHEVAMRTPLNGDPDALPRVVLATATVYGKALARGLPKSDAARVHFNLGLLLDAVSKWPEGQVPVGFPASAAEAYAAAIEADPGYAEAALKLLSERIASRDVAGAVRILATLPPGVDPKERAVLESALAHVKGDRAGAVRLLTGPGGVAIGRAEPSTAIAHELLLLGYRRLVVALVADETRDAARIALRLRAEAALGDVNATAADLALLKTLDAARAADLRRNDADLRRTLGAPSAR